MVNYLVYGSSGWEKVSQQASAEMVCLDHDCFHGRAGNGRLLEPNSISPFILGLRLTTTFMSFISHFFRLYSI